MKLEPGIPVAKYPLKLRELATKRAQEYQGGVNIERIDKQGAINIFCFSSTPEGTAFWGNVAHGREIPDMWGEEIENYQIY